VHTVLYDGAELRQTHVIFVPQSSFTCLLFLFLCGTYLGLTSDGNHFFITVSDFFVLFEICGRVGEPPLCY